MSNVILGLTDNPVSKWDGVKGLLDREMSSGQAVRRCLKSLQRKQKPSLVRLNRAIHTAVFAPSGVGKGVSIVIPHLLTCRDSMVVIDPKGELYRATAKARMKMGHHVRCVDPYKVVAGNDTLNSLADIDPESDAAPDECRTIANAIVTRTGKEDEPFWSDAAEAEIALAIGFVVCVTESDEKNLQSVCKILSDATLRLKMLETCQKSDKWHGLLARWAGQSASLQDKTLHSVMAHVHTHMRFLDTPPVMRNTLASSFQPKTMFSGRTTIYLVLPPEHLRAQAGLMRLWIGSLLRTCVKNGAQERKVVRFILDEAVSLGKLDCLADAVDQYRGYGVRLLFVYQSLGQLFKCWPDGQDQTLLSNVTQVFFGVNDQKTAEYVSARLGEYTQVVTSGGYSRGGSSSYSHSQHGQGSSTYGTSWNENDNWQQAARKLLKPEEVMALDPRLAITFTPGVPPIWTELIRYYEGIPDTRMGFVKMVTDTICLFLLALIIAALATAKFNPQLLRSFDVQTQGNLR